MIDYAAASHGYISCVVVMMDEEGVCYVVIGDGVCCCVVKRAQRQIDGADVFGVIVDDGVVSYALNSNAVGRCEGCGVAFGVGYGTLYSGTHSHVHLLSADCIRLT